jgi:hypothetical protein
VAKICPFSTSDFFGLFDDDDSDGYAEDDDPDDVTNGTSQWRRPSNDAMCELWMHVANSANLPSSNAFHIKGYNQQNQQQQTSTDVPYGAAEDDNDGLRIDDANRPTRSSTNETFEQGSYLANSTNLPSSKFYITQHQQIRQHPIDTDDNNSDAEEDDNDEEKMIGACQWRQSSNYGTFRERLYVESYNNPTIHQHQIYTDDLYEPLRTTTMV